MRKHRRGAVAVLGVMVVSMAACGDRGQPVGAADAMVVDTVMVPAQLPQNLRTTTTTQAPSAGIVAAPIDHAAVTVPRPLRRATLMFTGDTLPHAPLVHQAQRNAGGAGYDFAPMFARVRSVLGGANLAVCHLETPVAPPGEAFSTAPRYGVPAEIAAGLASAGYDRCSTASNHSMDRGVGGIDATVGALESAGISQSGMARVPDEAVTSLVEVNGINIAHISYTFSLNGLRRPEGEPWRVNMIDDGGIVDAARDARARGADVVILSLHWGTEGVAEPNRYQLDVANWITASGTVDLIVGHHAHVPQPVIQVNGTWVAFGLGNFLSNMPTDEHWPASTQDGVALAVTIDEQPDGRFAVERPTVIPTWVDRAEGWVIRPVVADLADPTVADSTKRQLERSLGRAVALYGDMVGTV